MENIEKKADDLREGQSGQWLARYGYATRGIIFLLVGGVGLGVGLGGLHTMYRGLVGQFMQLYPEEMDRRKRAVALQVGRAGLVALGIAMSIVGYHAVWVALTSSPGETIGLGGALRVLGAQSYGRWLLGAVSLDFMMYGVHCFMLGLNRKVRRG